MPYYLFRRDFIQPKDAKQRTLVDKLSRAMKDVRGLAPHLTYDLARAVVEGWLQRDELEDIVARCAACGRGAACEAWLVGSGSAHAMPDFCPNKAGIEALG